MELIHPSAYLLLYGMVDSEKAIKQLLPDWHEDAFPGINFSTTLNYPPVVDRGVIGSLWWRANPAFCHS